MIGADAKVQRITLSEQVEGFIRADITSRKVVPGQSLPSSTHLAEQFGVSRAIVREAMKSLEAKGMITITNGKRAIVSPINNQVLIDYFDRMALHRDEALIELLELRKGIEVQSALLAAERRTSEEMEDILRLVEEMRRHVGDTEAYLDVDVQLHLAIVKASQNRMLFHLADSIRGPSRDTMKEGQVLHPSDEERENIQAAHEILVRYIDQRDAEGAAHCMATHFDAAIAGIVKAKARYAL